MAGFVPAIHVLSSENEFVDGRDKPGHDEHICSAGFTIPPEWKTLSRDR
jgi:hypothetical protein